MKTSILKLSINCTLTLMCFGSEKLLAQETKTLSKLMNLNSATGFKEKPHGIIDTHDVIIEHPGQQHLTYRNNGLLQPGTFLILLSDKNK